MFLYESALVNPMRVTLATVLTSVRLFLILPILILFSINPVLALVLLVIAIVTDTLDGIIARKTNTITKLGTFLDHFADKILVHTVLLYFVATQGLSAIAFGIFVIRDFLVLGIRHLATQKGKEIPSMLLGKIKFIGQSALLILLALSLAFPAWWLLVATEVVLWMSVVLAVVSAFQILSKGWPALRE